MHAHAEGVVLMVVHYAQDNVGCLFHNERLGGVLFPRPGSFALKGLGEFLFYPGFMSGPVFEFRGIRLKVVEFGRAPAMLDPFARE